MKKGFLKVVSAACAAAALVTCAAGCGAKKETASGNVTTVTFWTGESHSKSVVTKYVNEWNETEGAKNGVKLEYVVKDGDISQAIDLALKTNQAPDLFVAFNAETLASENKILALDDIPDMADMLKKFEGIKNQTNCKIIDGKTYSLPKTATTQGLIYNKDMFKAAGIVDENGEAKPPTTVAEVRECAKKLTNVKEKKFGIIFPAAWSDWFGSDVSSMLIGSTGNSGYDPTTGKYDYSGLKPMIDMIMGIKEDGSYFPGAENLDNDTARARFAEGNIGMKFAYSFDVGVFNDQFPAKCDWGVAPLPVADAGKKYLQRMSVEGGCYVNAQTAEKKGLSKIAAVLKFLYGDDFVREMYKTGMQLPYDFSIVDGIELDNAKKGWKEFAELVSISTTEPLGIKYDGSGIKPLRDVFINEIWSGANKDVEGILKDYSDSVNNAAKQYCDEHPEYDYKSRIIPDWNVSR